MHNNEKLIGTIYDLGLRGTFIPFQQIKIKDKVFT